MQIPVSRDLFERLCMVDDVQTESSSSEVELMTITTLDKICDLHTPTDTFLNDIQRVRLPSI